MLPRSCNKPRPGPGHGPARARPARRAARPGLRVPLRRALPRRGRTPDPRRSPGWTSRRCRRRPTTRSTTRPARWSSAPAAARTPILMNCSGKHAAMLATCVRQRLGHRDLPRRRTTRSRSRSRDTFAEMTGEPVDHGRGRRLRGPAASRPRWSAWPARSAGWRSATTAPTRTTRRRAGRRGDPRAPRVRVRHAPRRARPAAPRSPARSARPAPSPATPWRSPTAAPSRSRPTTARRGSGRC